MGRKGDITTKVIGVRAPIKVYTKLLNEASDKGISLSVYCVSLLSKDNFNQGGQTKIEYQERWHIDPKLVKENSLLKAEIVEREKKYKEDMAFLGKELGTEFRMVKKVKEENELLKKEVQEWKDRCNK